MERKGLEERIGSHGLRRLVGPRQRQPTAATQRLKQRDLEDCDATVLKVLEAIKQVPKRTIIDNDLLRHLAGIAAGA
jgi:hypothetical protein